jgi:hypothetical protein
MTPQTTIRLIDVHAHTGAMPLTTFATGAADLERMEAEAGVVKAVVSSARAVFYEMVTGNRETFDLTRTSPMLYMYIYVDPHRPDESLAEIEKYAGLPHVAGIKSRSDYHGLPADCDEYLRIYKAAVRHELPMLMHAFGAGTVKECVRAAEKTGLRMILGHMGGPEWRQAVDAAKDSKHVWLDACASMNDYDKIGYALDVVGPGRIVFGSDAVLINPWWTLSMFESAGLADAEKQAIYHDNALGIFGRRLA